MASTARPNKQNKSAHQNNRDEPAQPAGEQLRAAGCWLLWRRQRQPLLIRAASAGYSQPGRSGTQKGPSPDDPAPKRVRTASSWC